MVRQILDARPRLIRKPQIRGDLVLIRQANDAAAGDVNAMVPIDVELAVLEQFPPEFRRAFNEMTIKVNCLFFVDHFNWAMSTGRDTARTLEKMREMEANEILVFAGRHRASFGYQLPHVAAGATVLRYGALGESRHAPRRLGKPIIRQIAKRRRRGR